MRLSRRDFLRTGSVSGIALTLSKLGIPDAALAEQPSFFERETLNGAEIPVRGRVDGVAKVTGAKLYLITHLAQPPVVWYK